MKTTFLKSEANFGCYVDDHNKQNIFLKNESFTIKNVLEANVSLRDKIWFIRHNCNFSNIEFGLFAIGCASCVVEIYERKYPNDLRLRNAIVAARQYLNNNSPAAAAAASAAADAAYAAYANAAYAADAAAYAAYAAHAAAYADYAADYAAAAAASAASAAAAYADDYVDDYADDKKYRQKILDFLKEFTNP